MERRHKRQARSHLPSHEFRIELGLQVLGQDGCPDDSLLWDLTQCDQQTLQWLQQLLLCLLHGGSRLGRLGVEVDINFGSKTGPWDIKKNINKCNFTRDIDD